MFFNPVKGGGSESMYRMGGGASHMNMDVYSPIFQGQLIEKKIRSITFKVCVLRRVKKIPKIFVLFLF